METHYEDQSFEAKKARALAVINRQMASRISSLRLIGPAKPRLEERHRRITRDRDTSTGASYCRFCTPPAREYKCPVCDWTTDLKWRMALHNDLNPDWCRKRGEKKARRWARQA